MIKHNQIPTPKKLTDYEKSDLKEKVQEFVQKSEKLSKKVNRFEIFELHSYALPDGWDDPEAKFIVPLIDGKYAEFPYARITVFTNERFSLGWQRHNGQWIELFEDTLLGCLDYIDKDNAHFY